jgi:hypothetical protein
MLDVETVEAPAEAYQRARLPEARSGPPARKEREAENEDRGRVFSVQRAPRLLSP